MVVVCFKGGYVHNCLNPRVQSTSNGPLTVLNCVSDKFHRAWSLFLSFSVSFSSLFGSRVGAVKFVCRLHRREPRVLRSVTCQPLGFHGRIKMCSSKVYVMPG